MNKFEEVERRLGLEFNDKNILRLALTHTSYINEKSERKKGLRSNQRLEFLGDAVLSLVVANYLYQNYSEQNEGGLTNLRSALVRRETLNHWARSFDLGSFLLMGKGEAGSGGRHRPLNLASAFEAVIGALYLDKGLPAVEQWLIPQIKVELELIIAQGRDRNYKSLLQEVAQRVYHQAPDYYVVGQHGPEHERYFEIEARIGEKVVGKGTGTTKQYAEQAAARAALEVLAVG